MVENNTRISCVSNIPGLFIDYTRPSHRTTCLSSSPEVLGCSSSLEECCMEQYADMESVTLGLQGCYEYSSSHDVYDSPSRPQTLSRLHFRRFTPHFVAAPWFVSFANTELHTPLLCSSSRSAQRLPAFDRASHIFDHVFTDQRHLLESEAGSKVMISLADF